MEERTPHPPSIATPVVADHTAVLAVAVGDHGAAEPPRAAQDPLPFDDEAEQPIPFALTARARRTVAPHALPTLRVVPPGAPSGPDPGPREGPAGLGLDDDPSDTRPSRARALRRAGVGRASIAEQLGVDELLVRAWTSGVVPPARPSRAATSLLAEVQPRDRSDELMAAAAQRQAAHRSAGERLRDDPRLAAGLGLLAGVADVDGGAITLTTGDPRVARTVIRWLVEVLGADPTSVRVVLRVGPRAAADLARHRWAQALDLAPERIRTTRAGGGPEDHGVEGVLRIADVALAATAAGWCDALLDDAVTAEPGF
ncbi:MAG: hypothetical protein WEB09_07865 [Nitriliruptor sp.]